MKTNFVEVAKSAVEEIHKMNMEMVEDFGEKYEECFPATTWKTIVIDGKEYSLKMEYILKPIK